MLESLLNKVEGVQILKTPILKISMNDCWVPNMSLKAQNLDQGATEMFISEFENKESLCNVMSKIYKGRDAKKSKFQKIAWIIWDKW